MGRFDLTDFEQSVIQPLRPTKVRGVKRVDDRRVLHGIFWRLEISAPWADIPARYGAAHDLREQVLVGTGQAIGPAYYKQYQRLTIDTPPLKC